MKSFKITKPIEELNDIFTSNGFSLYLVGGAVRDYLLSIENHDYDFTTDATPQEIIKIFPNSTIPTGIKHGTVTVLFKKKMYEITTFRAEKDYLDKRHPRTIEFIRDLNTDLERRDFTINALAVDLKTGKILDYHNGIEDLKNKTIRAIGDAEKRFDEDGLRLLRAARFASKLNFEIEEKTFNSIKNKHENIKAVSAERIREELFKLLTSPAPHIGLNYLKESKLLDIILPEFVPAIGFEQKGFHKHDLWTHTILTAKAACDNDFDYHVKLAAFFHDIGKTTTRALNEFGVYTFFNHETESERITKTILKRLKASNEDIFTISHLIRNHMFNYTSSWSDSAVRRFMNRVGIEYIPLLFQLRLSDQIAISGKPDYESIGELEGRIDKILKDNCALKLKDLKLDGNDIMKLFNVKGVIVGNILNYLLEQVLEDPLLNEKEKLEKLAISYMDNLK